MNNEQRKLTRAVHMLQYFLFLYHLELINQNLGGPLTNFNDWGGREGGGPTEVHILYSKKSQLQNLSTQKIP